MSWSKDLQEKINKLESELQRLLVQLNAHGETHSQACENIAKQILILRDHGTNSYRDVNLASFTQIKTNLNLANFHSSTLYATQANAASATLDEIIKLMEREQEARAAVEAKTNEKFLLSDDILKDVFSLQGNASNPTSPQQAPIQIKRTIDDTKNEITYFSQTNPGKVITHNLQYNTVKAEGFDDNLEALLKTLKGLADERSKKSNQAKLTFQLTEPKSLTEEKLNEALTKAGYEKNKHSAFVEIILSPEIIARNATQPANQAAQQADSKSGGLTITTARKSRNQLSVDGGNESHIGLNSLRHP